MLIEVSVQYNGGLLPDIVILLTLASVSTIGGGGGTTILSPRRSPKQPLPGIGLHDPLHGR